MKRTLLGMTMGLFLVLPQLAMAQGANIESNGKLASKAEKFPHNHHHQINEQQYQKQMREKEQKLLSLVDHYTPEKRAEWKKVIDERNRLRAKWLSPEFAEKREQWKKEKMKKMAEQKKQSDQGKSEKEDFMKKNHSGMKREHWQMYHQLKSAVENHHDQEAARILNQILTHYKHHNEVIKQAMSQNT